MDDNLFEQIELAKTLRRQKAAHKTHQKHMQYASLHHFNSKFVNYLEPTLNANRPPTLF